MAQSVNKAIIIGNLGKDPEIRFMTSGQAIANFSVATSESWKDKNSGEWKDKTEWHNIVVMNKQAETIGERLHKGSKVYVEGSIQTRKWTDKEGKDRYSTEIKVGPYDGTVMYLDPKPEEGAAPARGASRKPPAHPAADDFDDSDIPF